MEQESLSASPRERYFFLLRRLHSLCGIVPVGVYLIVHLTVNSTVYFGADAFQDQVNKIHSLGVFLVPVEIVGIFLPILFHAILGVVIICQGSSNATNYRYGGNVRYTLQRVTGGIAFIFIMYHVWQTHKFFKGVGGGGAFDPHAARASIAAIMQSAGYIPWVYAIGMGSAVFHLANGIWTSLITWGITIGENAQRKSGYVCTALGIALFVLGMTSVLTLENVAAPPSEEHAPAIRADAHSPVQQSADHASALSE